MNYQAKKIEPKGERKVLNKGKSWMRWFAVPVVLFAIPQSLDSTIWINILIIAIAVGWFFLLRQAKRLEHDQANLYIIRNKNEQTIPFTSIISIKRSAAKVNGERYWKLKYKDDLHQRERTIRFFKLFFNKEFHTVVRIANPKVVIWTHPHFAHAEDNKHNPDYKE